MLSSGKSVVLVALLACLCACSLGAPRPNFEQMKSALFRDARSTGDSESDDDDDAPMMAGNAMANMAGSGDTGSSSEDGGDSEDGSDSEDGDNAAATEASNNAATTAAGESMTEAATANREVASSPAGEATTAPLSTVVVETPALDATADPPSAGAP
eukprot:scpid55760/ scgid8214/ 